MMNIKSTVLILVGVLFLSSCERALIPESRFIDIYHDIILADYHIGSNPSLVASTDSIVAYEGIIESHGYTIQQFIFAQDFYLAHPEDFSKMLKKLQKRFDKEVEALVESSPDTLQFERPNERKPKKSADLLL